MNTDFWIIIATISGPIISAIAIVVALLISHHSSRDAQKQVDALHKQIDAFKAAYAPFMLAQLEQYKEQLMQIDAQIARAQQEYEVVNPFWGHEGAQIDKIDYLQDKKRQAQSLSQLKTQREKIVNQIGLINSFLGIAEE